MEHSADLQVILTKDGSYSLYSPHFDQFYHSIHGSLQESLHIYIDLGLRRFKGPETQPLRIFEMGFGTGLNALLTLQWAHQHQRSVQYVCVEAYPLLPQTVEALHYENLTGQPGLQLLQEAAWGVPLPVSPLFEFTKIATRLQDFTWNEAFFDVIYFDAFAPRVQPELWTHEIFAQVAAFTATGGNLVTYCAKSIVQRALRQAGFVVEKHPGPHGKRHVLRGIKG
ncbi:tRNA (5-methylaminomethyl-2-thiouridine)(34)-methyltransferase MnmD [Arundinibacter roseus]|uniref:MnmC-like methyltransferase domain-containing protein n=1 Tax=Arundinibacter roseus TaxID=2070510 RepID=A0A4R4KKS6_9BACT|nr:tRNA (5-methylaminomethyl-2-thiouridine)(34)-methyltransferase MnmD [Arundinibacter roseus]TDB68880.1 hypothetical protein EZE20_00635 [Arundinibacter roseus]